MYSSTVTLIFILLLPTKPTSVISTDTQYQSLFPKDPVTPGTSKSERESMIQKERLLAGSLMVNGPNNFDYLFDPMK